MITNVLSAWADSPMVRERALPVLLALAVWIGGSLLAWWVSRLAGRLMRRGGNGWRIGKIVEKGLFYLPLAVLLPVCLNIAGVPLDLTRVWNYKIAEVGKDEIKVSNIVIALLLVLGGLIVSRVVSRLTGREMLRRRLDATAADAVQKLVFWVLLVAVAATALEAVNVPMTSFAFLGGAVAIGVGFGAQNIINNFISGWILLAERPVRLNDVVEVDGHTGRVAAIGARCTRIRRADGVDVLVPNSKLLENIVVNWTLMDDNIRTTIRLGVAYGANTRKVETLIRRAIEEHEAVLREPAPLVIFEDFGDNALIFDAAFWTSLNGALAAREVASDIRHRLEALCREAGIAIPFPQRDVHVDTSKPLEVRVINGERNDQGPNPNDP